MFNSLVRYVLRSVTVVCVAAVVVTYASVPAQAAMSSYDVTFSANTFEVGSGPDAAPVDPVVGHFTITFDPTLDYTDETAGIALNSLNIALGSSLSFTYRVAPDGPFPANTLRVGGIASGADVVTYTPSQNDFWLHIVSFTTTPTFEQLGYSQSAVSSNNLFYTLNGTGSVTVTPIPEPATLGLLATGCLALVRRRRAQPLAA